MKLRHILALTLLVAAAGCGVKSDLVKPDHQPTEKHHEDPSKPPSPLGR